MGWVLILPWVFFFRPLWTWWFQTSRLLRGLFFCPEDCFSASCSARVSFLPCRGFCIFCPAGVSFLPLERFLCYLPCTGFVSALQGLLFCPEGFLSCPGEVPLPPCRGFFPALQFLSCPASFLVSRGFFLALQGSFLPCTFLPCRGFFSALQGVPFHPEEDPCRTAGGTS